MKQKGGNKPKEEKSRHLSKDDEEKEIIKSNNRLNNEIIASNDAAAAAVGFTLNDLLNSPSSWPYLIYLLCWLVFTLPYLLLIRRRFGYRALYLNAFFDLANRRNDITYSFSPSENCRGGETTTTTTTTTMLDRASNLNVTSKKNTSNIKKTNKKATASSSSVSVNKDDHELDLVGDDEQLNKGRVSQNFTLLVLIFPAQSTILLLIFVIFILSALFFSRIDFPLDHISLSLFVLLRPLMSFILLNMEKHLIFQLI
jgi:hypothetical protein